MVLQKNVYYYHLCTSFVLNRLYYSSIKFEISILWNLTGNEPLIDWKFVFLLKCNSMPYPITYKNICWRNATFFKISKNRLIYFTSYNKFYLIKIHVFLFRSKTVVVCFNFSSNLLPRFGLVSLEDQRLSKDCCNKWYYGHCPFSNYFTT